MTRGNRPKVLIPLLVAASLCAGGGALAQKAPAPSKAAVGADASKVEAAPADAAEEQFRRGNGFYKDQKWADAEVAYEAALALRRTHDIASNLGHTEMKQGKAREAAEHLALALRVWPPTVGSERRAYTAQALEEAKKQVVTLEVSVSAADAEVVVDGKVVGRSPLEGEVFVEAGPHVIEAKLSEHEGARQRVDALAGSTQKVVLTLKKTGPIEQPPPGGGGGALKTAVIIGGAVASAAALGIGLGFTVAANGKRDDAAALLEEMKRETPSGVSLCAAPTGSRAVKCEELYTTVADWDRSTNIAIGSLVAGGVLTLGTVTAAILMRPRAPNVTTRSAFVTPVFGPTIVGVSLDGQW